MPPERRAIVRRNDPVTAVGALLPPDQSALAARRDIERECAFDVSSASTSTATTPTARQNRWREPTAIDMMISITISDSDAPSRHGTHLESVSDLQPP
jgi:hypothetical protein